MTIPSTRSPRAAVAVEIAVQGAASARAALRAGATRIELCSALTETGGLTPSIGLIERVAAEGIPTHVLIRPRPGDFVYDADDRLVMQRDIRAAIEAGAAGVVSGGLTARGEVDDDVLQALLEAAAGTEFTFHRAVDAVADREAALDSLIAQGVQRVLTSGGAARCSEGVLEIGALVTRASERLEIQAGGRISLADLPALIDVGVSGIHLSASRRIVSARVGPGGGDGAHDIADEGLIAAVVAAVRSL